MEYMDRSISYKACSRLSSVDYEYWKTISTVHVLVLAIYVEQDLKARNNDIKNKSVQVYLIKSTRTMKTLYRRCTSSGSSLLAFDVTSVIDGSTFSDFFPSYSNI